MKCLHTLLNYNYLIIINVAPLGIEPRSEVPETPILSVVLQSQFY